MIDGQPVVFFGRKGDAPGSAIEIVNDGSFTPITQQNISFQGNARGSFTRGSIRSPRIGPVSSWEDYAFNISEESNDSYLLNVFGIDTDGNSVLFDAFQRGRAEKLDISSINATTYPEIELEFSFEDNVDLTPPQLNFL